MKKFLPILLILTILISTFTLNVNAREDSTYNILFANQTYSNEKETTEIISIDESLTKEQVNSFLDYLTGAEATESKGLTCFLFGHDLVYEGSVVIMEHKVYADSPRCVRKVYDLYSCSRCSHEKYDLISSRRIDCCPSN